MNKILLFISFLFPSFFGIQTLEILDTAKTLEVQWAKEIGGFREDKINKVFENVDGTITAIGETRSKSEGGKDVLFMVLNDKGTIVQEKRIGRTKDEVVYSGVQAFDGGYVLVGYSDSPEKGHKGGKDGLVIKLNNQGIVEWYQILGTKEDDEITDIIQLDNGHYQFGGTNDGRVWVGELDAKGESVWQKKHLYNRASTKYLNSIAPSPDGNFIGVGYEQIKKKKNVYLVGFDSKGERLWEKSMEDEGIELGRKIVNTKDGGFAVTGNAYISGGREQMFLLKLDPKGEKQWVKTYGGRGNDGAYSMIEDYNGNFVAVGYNSSFERGASRDKLWVNMMSSDGEEVLTKPFYYGGKYSDGARDIIQLKDGSYLVGGFTTKLTKSDEAWLIKFKPEDLTGATSTKVALSEPKFADTDNDSKLSHDEAGFVEVTVRNNDSKPAFGILGLVDFQNRELGAKVPKQFTIGYIAPNSSKKIRIPISGTRKMKTGTANLKINIVDKKGSPFATKTVSFGTREIPMPRLAYTLKSNTTSVKIREKTNRLELDIKNSGSAPASNLYARFDLPANVRTPDGSSVKNIGALAPGASRKISLDYIIGANYTGERFDINCKVFNETPINGENIVIEKKAKIAVQKFEESELFRKKLEVPTTLSGGSNNEIRKIESEVSTKEKREQEMETQLEAIAAANLAREKKRLAEEQRIKEAERQAAEARKLAEAKREAEEAEKKRLEAEAAKNAAEQKRLEKEAAELERKRKERAEIERKRKEKEEKAAQAKRQAEEAARKKLEADQKRLEDQAKEKAAEDARLKKQAAEAKRKAEEARKAAETKQKAEAEERKRIEAEQKKEAARLAAKQKVIEQQRKEAEKKEKELKELKLKMLEEQRKEAARKKKAEEAMRKKLAKEELAKQKKEEAERARLAKIADDERKRKEAELQQQIEEERQKRKAEEDRLRKEKERIDAENAAEEARLKKEAQEATRLAREAEAKQKAIEAERKKLAEDKAKEEARIAAETKRLEAERKALEEQRKAEAEKERLAKAEEEKRQKEEAAAKRKLEEEQKRIQAEKEKIAAAKAAEESRLKKQEASRAAEDAKIKAESEKLLAEKAALEAEREKANAERKALEDEKRKLQEEMAAMRKEIQAERDKMKSSSSNFLVASWINEVGTKTVVEPKYQVIVKAISTKQLKKEDFVVTINGKKYGGSKFDEVDLFTKKKEQKFDYTFIKELVVSPGANDIKVFVKNEAGEEQLDGLIVKFAPRKPNLYMLSVGVAYKDLKFTTKDAADFAKAYNKNPLFNNIEQTILNDKDATQSYKIVSALNKLKFRYAEGEITDNDVVMVFISSHGTSDEGGSFLIKGSNFDGFAKAQTSVSYKKDLLGALNDMFCKKLVFMDACYSGKAVQGSKATDDELELSGEIAKLVSANAGTRTFVSCSAKQLSYEDAKWENGAFTKALLEAFNAVPNKKNVADKDKNGVVNVAELYDYVYVRVPEIVKTKKDPKPQTEQTPFMPESQRREDLPIFAL